MATDPIGKWLGFSGIGRYGVVEPAGFEPATSSMPSRRAPNCATAPRKTKQSACPYSTPSCKASNTRDSQFRCRTRVSKKRSRLKARYELEYRPYGQNHFSRCGRHGDRFEVSDRSGGEAAAGGLRALRRI